MGNKGYLHYGSMETWITLIYKKSF